jgi:dTDP-glucose 4,6-dehydratase
MKLIVTGGAGFIGSNFIRYWLSRYPQDYIFNFDLLTYAGNLENLKDVNENYASRYELVRGDITDSEMVNNVVKSHQPDIIVHFASESHNSRAVLNPTIFFRTNVLGTQTLLEAARKYGANRFHHMSTCEVFGELPLDSEEKFTESHPYRPRTPYNASKAAADHLIRAYFETYKLPVTISICSNNYGKYQHPEKLIPLFTTNAIEDKPLPLYQHSQNRREWLHVLDHCKALELIIKKGKVGETYNIGSGEEKSIEEVADMILEILGKPKVLKTYVPDRPGHDCRYLLDHSKIQRELTWEAEISFELGLKETIDWYVNNRSWWQNIKARAEYQAVRETDWGEKQ